MGAIVLGVDVGTSSVKASLVDAETAEAVASSSSPANELSIHSAHPGWAEQDPETWWEHVVLATRRLAQISASELAETRAIGLSYQEHGLVLLDRRGGIVRPAIIWCDNRAVETGDRLSRELGEELCFRRLLNSPGNFTAAKLRWVQENEPDNFARISTALLPGDYIAYRMSGELGETPEGLSEWILWDFESEEPANFVLDHCKIPIRLLPPLRESIGRQGVLCRKAALELGLRPGIPITYRGGDQHSNAVGLSVLDPGETAVSAGTSGVVFVVMGERRFDPESRVNSFLHVNHRKDNPRLCTVMCINGAAIAYRWLRSSLFSGRDECYGAMNRLASQSPIGAKGLYVFPFGNGGERTLGNRNTTCTFSGIDFNTHQVSDLVRAVQEGVAFAFRYGMDILSKLGLKTSEFRAGNGGLFRSAIFGEALAALIGAPIELRESDAARGAAWGAAVGEGLISELDLAAKKTRSVAFLSAGRDSQGRYEEVYARWRERLLAWVLREQSATERTNSSARVS